MQKGGWYDWSIRKCQRRWGRCKSGPISRFCAVDSSEGSGTVVWWCEGRCIAVDSKRHNSNHGYVRTRPRRAGLALTKLLLKEARHGCCASFTHFGTDRRLKAEEWVVWVVWVLWVVWTILPGAISINFQRPANSYQLSTIHYQLSTINYQLSTINYQLSAPRLYPPFPAGLKCPGPQVHAAATGNIKCQV